MDYVDVLQDIFGHCSGTTAAASLTTKLEGRFQDLSISSFMEQGKPLSCCRLTVYPGFAI